MGSNSKIEWTTHTFNIAWGCTKVSPGCANCYAEKQDVRYGGSHWGPSASRRVLSKANWKKPEQWDRDAGRAYKRARVFCSSMCDIFEDHPTVAQELERLWPLIRMTPNLDWQLLTKRPENIEDKLPSDWGDGYSNVWIGVSIESQQYAERAAILCRIPVSLRFVSYEPALGPLRLDLAGIDWVIYGGESGPGFRIHRIEWADDMYEACKQARIAFFYKQSPGYRPGTDPTLRGKVIQEFPRDTEMSKGKQGTLLPFDRPFGDSGSGRLNRFLDGF